MVEHIADLKTTRRYDTTKPRGVRGRSSDNTQILRALGWDPRTPLREGMEKTYEWIEQQVLDHENAEYRK